MEYFNTKINHCGGQNLPQRPFCLSKPEFSNFISLIPTENELKKKKNKVRY
jgi:hypothetical protein